MTNLLGDIESPHHYFKPAWRPDNRLMGMEVITSLAPCDSPERLSQTGLVAHLDSRQQIALFNEKIELLEQAKVLIESLQITIWLTINDIILTEMMQRTEWVTRLQHLSFLTLMIDEDFPGLAYGRKNLRLIWLKDKFPLALANFGAGNSSNRPVFDGLFRHIFLDQGFIHNHSQRLSFTPFANAIIRQITPCCDALMISGIDDMALYQEVQGLDFTAMRGNLWPAIGSDELSILHKVANTL